MAFCRMPTPSPHRGRAESPFSPNFESSDHDHECPDIAHSDEGEGHSHLPGPHSVAPLNNRVVRRRPPPANADDLHKLASSIAELETETHHRVKFSDFQEGGGGVAATALFRYRIPRLTSGAERIGRPRPPDSGHSRHRTHVFSRDPLYFPDFRSHTPFKLA